MGRDAAFVGVERARLVQQLLERWSSVKAGAGPHAVVLSGPLGWGKTRIVQEFYAEIAAAQDVPPYWPPEIHSEPVDPLAARKRTYPSLLALEAGSRIPFMWWGLLCYRRPDGRLANALVEESVQLYAHALSVEALSHKALRRALSTGNAVAADGVFRTGSLVLDLLGLFGATFPPVAAAKAVLDAAKIAVEMSRRYRTQRRRRERQSGERVLSVDEANAVDVAEDLASAVVALSQHTLPFVVVIDDAHDAGPEVMAFVAACLRVPEARVLVLLLTWPERLDDAECPLGAWFRGAPDSHFGIVDVVELEPLASSELARLVRTVAPNTRSEVVQAFVERFEPNPFALRQALSFRAVRSSLRDGAIQMSVERVMGLESDLGAQYQRKWRELPESVRDVLMVSAELGREFVADCSREAALALALETAMSALVADPDLQGWARPLDEWVDAFIENDLHRLAKAEWLRSFGHEEAAQLSRAVRRFVQEQRRERNEWMGYSPLARRCLLEATFTREEGRRMTDIDWHARLDEASELAELYDDEGRYLDAAQVLSTALGAEPPVAEPKVATLVHALGAARLRAGDLDGAIESFDLALSDASGLAAAERAVAALDRVSAIADLGDYEGALAQLEGSQPVEGDAHQWLALNVRILAELGRFDAALAHSADLVAEAAARFGSPSPEHLHALNLRGWCASRTGRVDEALRIAEEALDEASRAVSPIHPEYLEAANNVARFAHRAGDSDRAIELGASVFEQRRRVLGPLHHKTLTSQDNLAVYLHGIGDFESALGHLEAALEGWRSTLGLDHPKALTPRRHRVALFLDTGRTDEAARDALDMLRAHRRVLGDVHPNTVDAALVAGQAFKRSDDAVGRTELASYASELVATGVAVEVAETLSELARR